MSKSIQLRAGLRIAFSNVMVLTAALLLAVISLPAMGQAPSFSACPGGSQWNGSRCDCPSGTAWVRNWCRPVNDGRSGGSGGQFGGEPQFSAQTLRDMNAMIRLNNEATRLLSTGDCTAAAAQFKRVVREVTRISAIDGSGFDWSLTTSSARSNLAKAEACAKAQAAPTPRPIVQGARSRRPKPVALNCRASELRLGTYQNALQETIDTAKRFDRAMALDAGRRAVWEQTMMEASSRAWDRAQFIWLELPVAKLKALNSARLLRLRKDGADLADLLASTMEPRKRENIRIARQFLAREKAAIAKLGAAYDNINDAAKLGGAAPLIFEDPEPSPTSPLNATGMKLREAAEMTFELYVERDRFRKLAANSALARYLAGGLATAFAVESAGRAMFDSLYDAFSVGLAWKQLRAMNLNAESNLVAVQKFEGELRKRAERLQAAKRTFAEECSKSQ